MDMYFLPFIKRKFKTNLSPEKVQEVLRKTTSVSDKKIDANKLSNLRIFESNISEKEFVIVMGRYALTYGKTSLLPIMKGTFSRSKDNDYTDLSISIHPFRTGIIGLSFFYLLAFAAIFICFKKGQIEVIVISIVFLLVTYGSLIAKFNKEVKTYFIFLQNELNAY